MCWIISSVTREDFIVVNFEANKLGVFITKFALGAYLT